MNTPTPSQDEIAHAPTLRAVLKAWQYGQRNDSFGFSMELTAEIEKAEAPASPSSVPPTPDGGEKLGDGEAAKKINTVRAWLDTVKLPVRIDEDWTAELLAADGRLLGKIVYPQEMVAAGTMRDAINALPALLDTIDRMGGEYVRLALQSRPLPPPSEVAGLVERLRAPIGATGSSSEDYRPQYDPLRLEAAEALERLSRPASVDWNYEDRLEAIATFGGRVVYYNGNHKVMLGEEPWTNCELAAFKTDEEARAWLQEATAKSGYTRAENPIFASRPVVDASGAIAAWNRTAYDDDAPYNTALKQAGDKLAAALASAESNARTWEALHKHTEPLHRAAHERAEALQERLTKAELEAARLLRECKRLEYPRNRVLVFSQYMERELRANDHKGHWSKCSWTYLERRIGEEVKELKAAIKSRNAEQIIEEAADVANFAMMVADCTGKMAEIDTIASLPPEG